MPYYSALRLVITVRTRRTRDNSGSGTPSTNPDDLAIIKVVVKDGPSQYFAGEKVDEADYEVVGIQANGEETPLDAAYLTFVADTTNQADYADDGLAITGTDNESVEAKVIGRIEYDGPYMATQGLADTVSASVYEMNAIDVAVKAGQKAYYAGSDISKLKDDYTVTAYAVVDTANDTAADAVYSRVLDSKEFALGADGTALVAPITAKEYTLQFDCLTGTFATADATPIKGGHTTATLTVLNDYITGFEVAAISKDSTESTATYAVIKGKATETPANYITVTYTKASSGDKQLTATGSALSGAGFTAEWGKIDGSETGTQIAKDTAFEDGKTYPIIVTANVGSEATSSEKSVSLAPKANVLKSFTVAVASASADKITAGAIISNTDFEVTAKWLDNSTDAVPSDATNALLVSKLLIDGKSTYTISKSFPAGASLGVEFTLSGYDAKCTNADTIKTKASI